MLFRLVLWGRIFILDFVYISGKFPSGPQAFLLKNEQISAPPPCDWNISIL
jgi:hypothetical protein